MSTQMQTCPVCGSQVVAGSRFCSSCGHAMAPDDNTSARVESGTDTPSQGSPTINVASQFAAGATPYPSASGNQSWQQGQYGPAPQQEQPRYAPPTQNYAPPPNLYGQQPPSYQQTALQPVGYSNAPLNQAPAYSSYGPVQNPGYAAQPQRDPTLALLLELIGYAGVLGIGHMYAGRTGRGVALLLGWIFYGAIAAVFFVTLVGAPLACLMLLLWPVVPIISGFWIKNDLDKERAVYGYRP